MGLVEEAVRLVRIGKVGRCAYHIRNLLRKHSKHSRGSVSCRRSCFLLHDAPVKLRCGPAEPFFNIFSHFRIGGSPCGFLCHTLRHYLTKFLRTPCIKFLHFRTDAERVVRIASEVQYSVPVCISAERSAMGLAVALV